MVKNPAVATMRKGFLSCACCMVPPARQQTMLTVSCVKHEARGASQSSMPSSYPITAWNVAMSAFKSGSVKTSRWMGGLLMCLWIPVESNRIKLRNGKNTITLSVPPTKIKMSRLHHEWMTKHTQFFIQFYVYKPPQQVWIGCPYISKHLLNLLFFVGLNLCLFNLPKIWLEKGRALKKTPPFHAGFPSFHPCSFYWASLAWSIKIPFDLKASSIAPSNWSMQDTWMGKGVRQQVCILAKWLNQHEHLYIVKQAHP